MKIALIYRCSRCKKEFDGSKLPTDKTAPEVADHMRAMHPRFRPQLIDYHQCQDKKWGVGEYVGFREAQDV